MKRKSQKLESFFKYIHMLDAVMCTDEQNLMNQQSWIKIPRKLNFVCWFFEVKIN